MANNNSQKAAAEKAAAEKAAAEKAAAEKAAAEKAAAEKAAAEKAAAERNAAKHPTPDPNAKRTKIIIHNNEVEDGDVYICVNGYSYLMQRETEVEVPDEVLEVFDNAVINTYRILNGEKIPLTIRRYSYSVVK